MQSSGDFWVSTFIVASFASLFTYYAFSKKPQQTAFKVKEIKIYPVKSCGWISLRSAKVGRYGLENDRKWMVIRDGNFLSLRQCPTMALVQPKLTEDQLILEAPGMSPLSIPLRAPHRREGPIIDVTLWSEDNKAVDEGDEAANWFKKFLKREDEDIRLVRQRDDHDRVVSEKYHAKNESNLVSFADGFPLLLTSVASLNDLNERMAKNSDGKTLPMTRFRTNINIEGGDQPWVEDEWKRVKIGGVNFRLPKRCPRCKATTVDPEKGEFDGEEPLKTLKTFRTGTGDKSADIYFGQNLMQENEGVVSVGDTVFLL